MSEFNTQQPGERPRASNIIVIVGWGIQLGAAAFIGYTVFVGILDASAVMQRVLIESDAPSLFGKITALLNAVDEGLIPTLLWLLLLGTKVALAWVVYRVGKGLRNG